MPLAELGGESWVLREPGSVSRQAIEQALAQFAALRPEMTSNIRSVVEAGAVATVINDWHLRGTAPDGTPISLSATSADVMRRRADGTWGILIDDPWALAGARP